MKKRITSFLITGTAFLVINSALAHSITNPVTIRGGAGMQTRDSVLMKTTNNSALSSFDKGFCISCMHKASPTVSTKTSMHVKNS